MGVGLRDSSRDSVGAILMGTFIVSTIESDVGVVDIAVEVIVLVDVVVDPVVILVVVIVAVVVVVGSSANRNKYRGRSKIDTFHL